MPIQKIRILGQWPQRGYSRVEHRGTFVRSSPLVHEICPLRPEICPHRFEAIAKILRIPNQFRFWEIKGNFPWSYLEPSLAYHSVIPIRSFPYNSDYSSTKTLALILASEEQRESCFTCYRTGLPCTSSPLPFTGPFLSTSPTSWFTLTSSPPPFPGPPTLKKVARTNIKSLSIQIQQTQIENLLGNEII